MNDNTETLLIIGDALFILMCIVFILAVAVMIDTWANYEFDDENYYLKKYNQRKPWKKIQL